MTIWFSSDQHLWHKNIIKFCNRPFETVEEMVSTIIQNHNKLVKPTDTVYWLGDFAWNMREDKLEILANKFNGKKHFIVGNHDRPALFKGLESKGVFESVNQTLGLSLGQQYIWLSHYPHRSWNRSFHGSYHLFGHCHGTALPFGLSFDVGVDCWNFCPINLETINETMNKLTRQFAEGSDGGERKFWKGNDV